MRDIGFALHACGVAMWEAKKIAAADAAKAALLAFLEIPWYLDTWFTADEVHHNVKHGFRETGENIGHKMERAKERWY